MFLPAVNFAPGVSCVATERFAALSRGEVASPVAFCTLLNRKRLGLGVVRSAGGSGDGHGDADGGQVRSVDNVASRPPSGKRGLCCCV